MVFIGPNAKNAAPALVAMFDRGNSQEKIFVCQAFGTIGPCSTAPESVRALIEGLNSQDTGLTISAAEALGGMGSQAVPAVPALVKLLANGNENIRKSPVTPLPPIAT